MVFTFKNIRAWQEAHAFVLEIYEYTREFPGFEKYGLISQIRRSSSSIATNIVEGYKKKSRKEFAHFINMAVTSLEETKYHLLLARDLGYLTDKEYSNLSTCTNNIGKMLFGFYNVLNS